MWVQQNVGWFQKLKECSLKYLGISLVFSN
jgi:hypothetical protein